MSPYRSTALLPVLGPSLWERFRTFLSETWFKRKRKGCLKKGGHRYRVSRYWNFDRHLEIYVRLGHALSGLGHDAVCMECGNELRSFQDTAEALKESRYVKIVGERTQDQLRAEVLNRLASRTLPDLRNSFLYPRKSYRGVSWVVSQMKDALKVQLPVEEHDPEEIFSWRYDA